MPVPGLPWLTREKLVLDELESTFHKHGSSITCRNAILSVLSAIGGERAMQMILDKLDYHHREVFYCSGCRLV